MKHSLKFFRYSCVILLALIVAVSAAIGVSADNSLTNYSGYDYVYSDSQGVIILSNSQLQVIPLRSFMKLTSISQADYLGFKSANGSPLIIFIPVSYGNTISYTMRIADVGVPIEYDENNNITTATTTMELGSFAKLYEASEFSALFNFYSGDTGMNGTEFFNSYTYNSNYAINHGTNTPSTSFPNQTINPNYSINDAFVSDNLTTNQLINAIDNAIQNNQNIITLTETIQIIIDYGSDYDQIDSNLIGNLGTAEDQLSSAEDAIQNKSKSLIQRAASGITSAKTASATLITSLSNTVPQLVSNTTDLIENTPEEVQAAVLSIPLLSFAAWLIGLKK